MNDVPALVESGDAAVGTASDIGGLHGADYEDEGVGARGTGVIDRVARVPKLHERLHAIVHVEVAVAPGKPHGRRRPREPSGGGTGLVRVSRVGGFAGLVDVS